MANAPKETAFPVLAVGFPYDPSGKEDYKRWQIKVGARDEAVADDIHALIMSMLRLSPNGGPQSIRADDAEPGGVSTFFVAFQSREEAEKVINNQAAVVAGAGFLPDEVFMTGPTFACAHDAGWMDASGNVHCRRCNQFMGMVSRFQD